MNEKKIKLYEVLLGSKENTEIYGVEEIQRETYACNHIAPYWQNFHKKLNVVLNVVFCLLTLFIFKFNLIAFAISFVVFDMISGFVDNYLFHVRPNIKDKEMTIAEFQNYVEKLSKKVESLKKEAVEYENRYCKKCSRYNNYNRSCYRQYTDCKPMREYSFYKERYEKCKRVLDKELKKLEEQTLVEDKTVSSDYQNKMEYFDTLKKKYSYFAKEKEMPYLRPIISSLTQLVKKLKEKPFALQLVPNTLYIYLDELQNVLNKLQTLSEEKKQGYLKDIEKISNALSENISDLNNRIDKFETEDIEVSLNVLLSELVKEKEERKEENNV